MHGLRLPCRHRPAVPSSAVPTISALILNYNASFEDLDGCISSVAASDSEELLEILIVENGSSENQDAPQRVAERYEKARVVDLGHNWGFSGGINRGVRACRGEWVMILNNDTRLDEGAIRHCADVLRKEGPEVMGVAPKLLFLRDPHVIDAIGNAVNEYGAAFNVGIGQLDVGQYDRVERCFGPCFAAALMRTDAFDLDRVGPLDESYFMYYEDVDWNWRANLFGYAFVTAPDARVYHVHSGSTRVLPFDFKYRLVERNLLSTVAKNCEGRRAAGIWKGRFGFHGRNVIRKHFRWPSVQIMFEAMLRGADSYEKRRQVNRRRVVSDGVVFRFAQGELPHFDPRNYDPERTLSNLIAMYRRKALVTGEKRWFEVAEVANAVNMTRLRFEPGYVTSRLLPLLEGEPDFVLDFVRQIEQESVVNELAKQDAPEELPEDPAAAVVASTPADQHQH
jgi:GT2 family glycosyltransferase